MAAILCAALSSCRDILPFENTTSIQGYQLNGTVTTPNGVAIDSVAVRLYYNYEFASDTLSDPQQVIVTKPVSLVDIAVYTPRFDFVRQLFFDYRPTGIVPRARWNGRDANGNLVPSGKYLIRYVVDTTIVKYSPAIIEGHVSATTDMKGHFTLTDDRFPVGDVFDLYDDANIYRGSYRVKSSVDIDMRKLTLHVSYSNVDLQKDRITTGIFILQ